MKVKYINSDTCLLTNGQIYEVLEEGKEFGSGVFKILAKNGEVYWFDKSRFEILPDSPIEEKKKQISDAKNTVTKALDVLGVLQKELADLTAPKVGNKYEHDSGDKYILTKVSGKFVLVCYDGQDDLGLMYISPVEDIKKAFDRFDHKFTLINP